MVAMRSHSQPLHNALSIFLVHFHVRRGNELIWQRGETDCQGVEWKALPSGSHATESDIIYFESPSASVHSRHKKIGIAAFRNRRLKSGDRVSASGEEQGEDDDQRGARLMAVGAILNCGEVASPWSILCATLPHIPQLEKLVDALSADPSCRGLLEEWLDSHQFNDDEADFPTQRNQEVLDLVHIHDPLLQLPAITNALGPLFPSLLKRLLLPSFRLLLFIPPGAQTYHAGAIAFALGELASAARREEEGPTSKSASSTEEQTVRIRGLVGLHDLGMLHDEAKSGSYDFSWIAWTTDRILLDKHQIYDALLDLSSMKVMSPNNGDLFDMPAALPKLISIRKTLSAEQKEILQVKRQTWTTREFAIFRGLDEQASSRLTLRRRKSAKVDHEHLYASTEESNMDASPSKVLSRQGSASTFLAFLRFWLSNLWILPLRWRVNIRESYGYVPLSIRSDGGVRASIMLLPDDAEEEEDSDEDDLSAKDVTRQQHLSLPLASPSNDRRSHSGHDHSVPDEDEDDPILAACGATRASLRHRRSRSHSSASHSGLQSVARVIASQLGPDDQETNFGISTSDDICSRGTSEEEEEEIQREARESIRLAASIYQVWSLWVEELVEGIQSMAQNKLDLEQQDHSRPSLPDNESRDELLGGCDDGKPLTFRSDELSELRLSATNPVDIELLRHIAGGSTGRQVVVQKSWWSTASSIWS